MADYHLLHIDDDIADNILLRAILEQDLGVHWEVRWAPDIESGLTYLEAQLPDAILLDLGLPGTNGLESLRHYLRLARHALPLIVLSGTDSLGLASMQMGAIDFLSKSALLREDFGPRLRVVIDHWRKLQDGLALLSKAALALRGHG